MSEKEFTAAAEILLIPVKEMLKAHIKAVESQRQADDYVVSKSIDGLTAEIKAHNGRLSDIEKIVEDHGRAISKQRKICEGRIVDSAPLSRFSRILTWIGNNPWKTTVIMVLIVFVLGFLGNMLYHGIGLIDLMKLLK